MRKYFLAAFFFALAYLPLFAEEIIVYCLKPVTEITAGQKYVFVQNGRAIDASVINGALQTVPINVSDQLMGNESYIWKVQKDILDPSTYNLFSNSNVRLGYISASGKLALDASGIAKWIFEYESDKTIIKVENSIGPFLGLTTADSETYGAFQSLPENHPRLLSVYQLVIASYTRTLASDNIGTICLPYQVDNYTGADIYQIAYKETDAQGLPTQIYYELISGPMQAGYPYVFVPNANQVYFPATEVRVDSPQDYKGFYGTFKNIQDKASSNANNTLEGNYMINATSQFQLCGVGCSLGAYRAYLIMNEVPLSSQVSAPTRQIMAIGQNTSPQFYQPSSLPTALFRTTATPCVGKYIQNGRLHILHNGVHYNLLGQAL